MRDKLNTLINRLDTIASEGSTPTLHNGSNEGGDVAEETASKTFFFNTLRGGDIFSASLKVFF